MRNSVIIGIFFLIHLGCAGHTCIKTIGWIDPYAEPDIITRKGISVWLMKGLILKKLEIKGLVAYLDIAHEELQLRGYDLPPAKIGLYPDGYLKDKRKIDLGGRAMVGHGRCPIILTWYGPYVGPYAFIHEELHRYGLKHKHMNKKIKIMEKEIRMLALQAMLWEIIKP